MSDRQAKTEKRESRIEREKQAWEWMMNDPRGRLLISSILDSVQLDETLFNGNSRDAFIEGRRAIGREVLQRARGASFPNYLKMLQEQEDDRTNAG